MKVVHVLFDDYPYISEWGYQENKLAFYQSIEHDVYIITGRYVPKILKEFVKYDSLKSYEEQIIKNHKRISIYRMKCLFGNSVFAKKIKYYKGLYKKLTEINPDVIFIHDIHAFSMFSVKRYIKNNKHVICNADIHTNYVNSCSNKVSKIMHKYMYRPIIQMNIKCINKLFYLNNNSKDFIKEMYGIDNKKCATKLLPLGGEIVSEKEIDEEKQKYLKNNNISSNSIVFLHSGKFTKYKKTIELIKNFSTSKNERYILILIGQPNEEIKDEFMDLISKDSRIKYLGWKSNEELMKYLKICDIYLQPGSPSVTAHEALCKKCLVLLSTDGDFYSSFVPKSSAYYIKNDNDLSLFFDKINSNKINIEEYKNNGYKIAKEVFDYRMQGEVTLK